MTSFPILSPETISYITAEREQAIRHPALSHVVACDKTSVTLGDRSISAPLYFLSNEYILDSIDVAPIHRSAFTAARASSKRWLGQMPATTITTTITTVRMVAGADRLMGGNCSPGSRRKAAFIT